MDAAVSVETPGRRFTVACVNWHYGGVSPTGGIAAWRDSVEALAEVEPDIVLCQEMDAGGNPAKVRRHLWRTANFLGMRPVLGPPAGVRSLTGNHTALLLRTHHGLEIVDDWPPPSPADPRVPWCKVELEVPELGRSLHAYSVHLSARSSVAQLQAAQTIASFVNDDDQLALIGGDFNSYPRGGPEVTSEDLKRINPHLRQTRTRWADDGALVPNYDVDDALVRDAGLVDVAAHLPAERRNPTDLRPTGRGGARVDRCYASKELADAATAYSQVEIGSDHDACVFTFYL